MKMTRRQAILASAAVLAWPGGTRAAARDVLRTGEVRRQLAPAGYPETQLWGYNGSAPGPEIRVRQGETLTRRLENRLPQATSVHWHGIRIDNAMDGVPGLTQEAVPPDGSFDYAFVAPDAGTYWYHSHNRSVEQVARGLYGPLIVDEAEGAPEVDDDLLLAIDDWRLTAEAQVAEDFENMHDRAHAGRLGNFATTNGTAEFARPVRRHERLRLRILNAANARIFDFGFAGFEGWLVALDGMPLARPEPLPQRLTLAPAQRADLIVDVTAEDGGEALLLHLTRDGGFAQAAFPVTGAAGTVRRDPPGPLPPNPGMALLDPKGARPIELLMEGGAMSRMMMGGGMRDMLARGQVWALNGIAGLPDAPLVEAARGETLRIPLVNDTAFPHAMHLHGHHFREILPDGSTGPMRDTILIEAGETREIVFAADNPGDWLLHCHMLAHQIAGMKTWLRVTA